MRTNAFSRRQALKTFANGFGMVGLAGGLLWRRARLEFQGLYLAPRTGEVARGELRAWLAAGGVHGVPGRRCPSASRRSRTS